MFVSPSHASHRKHRSSHGRRQQLALLGVGLSLINAAAFARPRGFGAVPLKDTKEATVIDVSPGRVAGAVGSMLKAQKRPGVDVVIAGGSLAGLWLAMLLSAGVAIGKVARVRLYKGKASKKFSEDTLEVATLEGMLWSQIPDHFRKVLTSIGFAEQWPKMEESEEEFPRNVAVFRLKDALEKYLEEADCVELISEDYSLAEHGSLLREDDRPQCIAFADRASLKACEEIFEDLFARPIPREAGGFLVAPERTLAVSVSVDEAPPLGTTMVLNWAQRRYFLNWAGEQEGVLQIRLTPDEGQLVAELMQTSEPLKKLQQRDEESSEALAGLWDDIRDACRIFDLPEGSVCGLALFAADVADRPSYTRFPGVEAEEEPLVAFLLGGAARQGSASFGPGFGASGDLEAATSAAKALLSDRAQAVARVDLDAVASHEVAMKGLCARERQVGLGLGQCIDSGLRNDGPQAEDTVLGRLEATLKQLRKHPQRWPPCVQDTLPSWEELQQQLLSRSVSARCWRAMAASGPWPDPAKEEAEKTVAEAEAAAYDFGGATEQGLQAAKSLEDQADLGSAESMFQLGVMYVTANGVDKDMSKAFHWIQKAADLEHLEAQNCVGTMLRNGLGVEIRKEEAAQWFEKAGARGHAEAQFNLGEMFWDAELPQDLEAAVLLFQKAAQADLDAAQFKLGLALRRGLGIEMDVPQGMQYIEKAAQHGLAEAECFLGSCFFSGDGVQRDLVKAASFFRRAAEQGDVTAQYSLGVMHELGEGVPRSDTQAQHWFRTAAAQGSLEAQARVRSPGLLPPPSA
ncbi:unnamed protein product [Durusdinium trenchii]|uniref:Uncharacterized protein n=1 Tax=Durusdinium trenchii TaxID=1381693 RepID=A0ABP0SP30_9DINO